MSLFNPNVPVDRSPVDASPNEASPVKASPAKKISENHIQNELNVVDTYFAELMADLGNTRDPELIRTFSYLSNRISYQDSYMTVSEKLSEKLERLDCVTVFDSSELSGMGFSDRGLSEKQLKTPLILVGRKLYLQKYFLYELKIAKGLIKRNVATGNGNIKNLDLLFPKSQRNHDDIDWQKLAAFQCLTRKLTVITGGPGTGKTTTVVKILAALLDENPDLRIKLAAPTGKAAARLSESIMSSSRNLPEEFETSIPNDVSTIHRLLGMFNEGHAYRYHKDNKLGIDLLILDEVSMIDLAMFTRILDAIPVDCRLILLGDPEQLLSVDTGAVMTDLYRLGQHYDKDYAELIRQALGYSIPTNDAEDDAEDETVDDVEVHPLRNSLCHLKTSYRFNNDLGIGKLAASIRNNIKLDFVDDDEVKYIQDFNHESLASDLANQYQVYFDLVRANASARELLHEFEKTRVLCPVREGEFGIEVLNQIIEASLFRTKSASTSLSRNGYPVDKHSGPLFHGKAIMITQNDYGLELFNGDIGICFRDTDGELKVAFHAQESEIRKIPTIRLPSWDTCFAMSIHKSQGSEFDNISLVLPPMQNHTKNLFTRELIYTAVTRARSQVTIYANPQDLLACMARGSNRLSGLQDRLNQMGRSHK